MFQVWFQKLYLSQKTAEKKGVSYIDDHHHICYNEIFSFWQDLSQQGVCQSHCGLAIYIFF
jgi:hypothetical protein